MDDIHFQRLNLGEAKDINILLLGETGVGKSTFINSLANYLHFEKFKRAERGELRVLIPSIINITDDKLNRTRISVGSVDKNEFQEVGASATQDVKTYVFPIGDGNVRVRLIDTPGMGDQRGVEQDDQNCENILAYLSQLEELHAICFLMKPTNARITVMFEYCFKQILSRLETSASNNIIFAFTNTRGEHYSGGETLPCLEKVVEDIMVKQPKVKIRMDKNVFYFDNEAFRILAAIHEKIVFSEQTRTTAVESWKKSSKECWRMISYILGDASNEPLQPHQLRNTTSINEARRLIAYLSKPLAEIAQLISDNIRILERHKKDLDCQNLSLDQMKKKLYIPVVDLKVTKLTQPTTVCASAKCIEVVQVDQVKKVHYKQRCHDPCYLTNIATELIGDPGLISCWAMTNKTCRICTCDFTAHMHIYYLTTPFDNKIEDRSILLNIQSRERALAEAKKLMSQIDTRKLELTNESEFIVEATARFAHFLQRNAITPFNDAYKAYIEYLITRERGLGRDADQENIMHFEELMRRHEELKKSFDRALQMHPSNSVSAKNIMDSIKKLYNLPLHGRKIREMMEIQRDCRHKEYDKNCEYVHPQNASFSDMESKEKSKKTKKSYKSDSEVKKDTKLKVHKNEGGGSNQFRPKEQRNYPPRGGNNNNQFRQREPPPPYPGHEPTARKKQENRNSYSDNEFKVSVEVTRPKESKQAGTSRQQSGPLPYYNPPPYGQGYGYGQHPPSAQYGAGPQNYGYPQQPWYPQTTPNVPYGYPPNVPYGYPQNPSNVPYGYPQNPSAGYTQNTSSGYTQNTSTGYPQQNYRGQYHGNRGNRGNGRGRSRSRPNYKGDSKKTSGKSSESESSE